MATKIIPQPPGRSTAIILQSTRSCVEDFAVKLEQIYAVASAGEAFIGEERGTEATLFGVIQDMASRTDAVQQALQCLADLGRALQIEGVHHG